MLDIKYIRDNVDKIKENNKNRHVTVNIDHFLELDEQKRTIKTQIEELRATRNQGSKGKPTPEEMQKMKEVGETIKGLEEQLAPTEQEYHELLLQIPNRTHTDSPIGGEEHFNVLEMHGNLPAFDFPAKDHVELMETLDIIDFERGAKVTGSKFYFLKNDAVRLNQALINYGMDILSKHGYTLIETPDLAKQEVLEGIGFNPRGEEKQIYNIENENLSLIGTAEITIGGYHQDEVLDLSNGPKKYAAISHCFRTEAGAYGRTSKGLYRVHQFTKLEMFIFCKPEDSESLHQELLTIEKEICDGLELAYRVIDIPTGDLGGPAYRKFDIEAAMTMKDGDYGEITSTSNCTDYQARRLNIKYKNEAGKNEYVHTLNGTAVVLSRFPLALIEQHQQKDGSIHIPKALVPYIGKDLIK
ncbi:MAG: serine--tRNA ligase [Candidatus Magasanikbacteria bacterium]|uniref:Serine--tRNA ligase n=1 Tax=Candidatus Magasanikbacteria bacterium CG10_big_fil_rev_8_21_14_0_10_38_6 TaxID=1974647 RepID=A0A2M6P1V1_9BACT|nr:serine--tRNA ligase [Candidatus Magasanikbacteria bacterium]NCS72214.1 serine--tRNA ligase [Candidatus Magasanikbacteria bacterium]PIR77658.1 MAG: serine--tRNA ligase [Candidatus Magasanikbacteria bacterium CG10_big_fil_rev_8_21_14_0_10_38_6]